MKMSENSHDVRELKKSGIFDYIVSWKIFLIFMDVTATGAPVNRVVTG